MVEMLTPYRKGGRPHRPPPQEEKVLDGSWILDHALSISIYSIANIPPNAQRVGSVELSRNIDIAGSSRAKLIDDIIENSPEAIIS